MAEDQSETVAAATTATAPAAAAPESPLPPVEDKRECEIIGFISGRVVARPLSPFWGQIWKFAVFIWLAAMMTVLKSEKSNFFLLLLPKS